MIIFAKLLSIVLFFFTNEVPFTLYANTSVEVQCGEVSSSFIVTDKEDGYYLNHSQYVDDSEDYLNERLVSKYVGKFQSEQELQKFLIDLHKAQYEFDLHTDDLYDYYDEQ